MNFSYLESLSYKLAKMFVYISISMDEFMIRGRLLQN